MPNILSSIENITLMLIFKLFSELNFILCSSFPSHNYGKISHGYNTFNSYLITSMQLVLSKPEVLLV